MTNTQPQTLDEVLDQAQAHLVSALQLAEKAHRQKDLRDRFPESVQDLLEARAGLEEEPPQSVQDLRGAQQETNLRSIPSSSAALPA